MPMNWLSDIILPLFTALLFQTENLKCFMLSC